MESCSRVTTVSRVFGGNAAASSLAHNRTTLVSHSIFLYGISNPPSSLPEEHSDVFSARFPHPWPSSTCSTFSHFYVASMVVWALAGTTLFAFLTRFATWTTEARWSGLSALRRRLLVLACRFTSAVLSGFMTSSSKNRLLSPKFRTFQLYLGFHFTATVWRYPSIAPRLLASCSLVPDSFIHRLMQTDVFISSSGQHQYQQGITCIGL